MSEDISLNTVAAEVGMSASYFSTIFSREMNQTFVEYLTEIRMNKAKELLTCSSLKTAEIAFETDIEILTISVRCSRRHRGVHRRNIAHQERGDCP